MTTACTCGTRCERDADTLQRPVLAVRVRAHGGLALYDADTSQQRACSLVLCDTDHANSSYLRYSFALMQPQRCMMLTHASSVLAPSCCMLLTQTHSNSSYLRYPFALMLPWHCVMLTPATNSYVWCSFVHVPPSHCMITSTCRRVCIHAREQLCAASMACCVHMHGCSLYCYSPGSSVCCCSSTTTQPGTSCLSSFTHTRTRAAVCCLHDVPSMYLGAACAAAPPRRRSRVRDARRRVRIHAYEQLCAVALACCVCTGVQLALRRPWGQLVLLPLRGDATGYVLFVVVHVSMHASSCVLLP